MSAIEVILGDFERGIVRIRYSAAGRAYLRLVAIDGPTEDIFLAADIAACEESGDGRYGELMDRWLAREGVDASGRGSGFRQERVFIVVLKDNRKLVCRSTLDTIAALRAACGSPPRPTRLAAPPPVRSRNPISRWLAPKT